mmetsp:Transcript_8159/g.15922  ORF Transcript_8159/g.15922 Transcript_8159/m.15922 type:complete len:225 (-) Transcript_8159:126-800(-)
MWSETPPTWSLCLGCFEAFNSPRAFPLLLFCNAHFVGCVQLLRVGRERAELARMVRSGRAPFILSGGMDWHGVVLGCVSSVSGFLGEWKGVGDCCCVGYVAVCRCGVDNCCGGTENSQTVGNWGYSFCGWGFLLCWPRQRFRICALVGAGCKGEPEEKRSDKLRLPLLNQCGRWICVRMGHLSPLGFSARERRQWVFFSLAAHSCLQRRQAPPPGSRSICGFRN